VQASILPIVHLFTPLLLFTRALPSPAPLHACPLLQVACSRTGVASTCGRRLVQACWHDACLWFPPPAFPAVPVRRPVAGVAWWWCQQPWLTPGWPHSGITKWRARWGASWDHQAMGQVRRLVRSPS